MSQDRGTYLIDADPELRAVALMMAQDWHPNDMRVVLKRSQAHIYRLMSRVREFLDHRPDQDD